jgi:hypothetical protein
MCLQKSQVYDNSPIDDIRIYNRVVSPYPQKNYALIYFMSHRVLNPITHRKFRKNIHFLGKIWDSRFFSITKFGICGVILAT